MRFQSTTNKSSVSLRPALYVSGVLIGVVILMHFFFPPVLKDALSHVAEPIWKGRSHVQHALTGVGGIFFTKQELQQENERLKKELNRAQVSLLNKQIIEQENRKLREVLGRVEENERGILGRVLVRPNISPYDTVLLDIGSEDGVTAGDVVLYADSTVLGEVVLTTKETSRVQLFSSPESKVHVSVGINATVQSTARGVGGGNFQIRLPRGVEVRTGDLIVPTEYPNYVVGQVRTVEKHPSDSFQTLFVKVPVNIYEVTFVHVVPRKTTQPAPSDRI